MSAYAPVAERLERNSIPEPNCGCLLWTGYAADDGYGRLGPNETGERRAHRAAWVLAHGPIPRGKFLCHKCDVRACINPAHLFVGDGFDNMRDMVAKGRNDPRRGSKNGWAKLTEDAVRGILRDPRRTSVVARELGLHFMTVAHIRKGRSWKHIPRAA